MEPPVSHIVHILVVKWVYLRLAALVVVWQKDRSSQVSTPMAAGANPARTAIAEPVEEPSGFAFICPFRQISQYLRLSGDWLRCIAKQRLSYTCDRTLRLASDRRPTAPEFASWVFPLPVAEFVEVGLSKDCLG